MKHNSEKAAQSRIQCSESLNSGAMASIAPQLLNNQQAAQYIDVSPGTLEVWRSQRRYGIPYHKIGGKVRYRREDLDRWLESRRVSSESDLEHAAA